MRANNIMIRKAFLTIMAVGCLLSMASQKAVAQQQKIDPTLEVTRNFDATMLNIYKSQLNTLVNDSLTNFNLKFDYSIFNKPYKDLYEFSPIPSVQIYKPVDVKLPIFLMKAQVAYPLSPAAEIYLQPRLKRNNNLAINIGYSGFYDALPALTLDHQSRELKSSDKYEIPAHATTLYANLAYTKYWKSTLFSFSAFGGYGRNFYYGYNADFLNGMEDFSMIGDTDYMRENNSHQFTKMGASMKLRSINAKQRGIKFSYDFNIDYRYTSDKISWEKLSGEKLKENFVRFHGEFGPNFGRYNRFTIGFNSENVLYAGIQDYKYGIYEINPKYTIETDRLTVKGGVKLSGRYKSKDKTDRFHNNIFVTADLLFEVAKDKFWVYGKLDGYNSVNSYSSLLENNRWIAPDIDLKATSVPFWIQAGLKGVVNSRFTYNLFFRFQSIEGLLQYVYMGRNMLDAEYSNTKCSTGGAELAYKNSRLDLSATIEYNSFTHVKKSEYNSGRPFGLAPLNIRFAGEYNWRERIFFGIDLQYKDEMYMYDIFYAMEEMDGANQAIKSPDWLNLGISLKYVLNRNFTLFINGNNLLDQEIIPYPNYIDKGVSFGGGVLVKF